MIDQNFVGRKLIGETKVPERGKKSLWWFTDQIKPVKNETVAGANFSASCAQTGEGIF